MEKKTKRIKKIKPPAEFNPQSPKQVGEFLCKLGVPLHKKTTKGAQWKTNDITLTPFREQYEFVDVLLRHRQVAKELSTYINPLHDANGVVYPMFNQTIVPEGRLSSSSPNIQNIKKHSEFGKKLRKCFVAKPGHSLVAFDYSQMHLRLIAHYSKDKTLIDAYRNNADIHQITADSLGVPRNPVAKTLNFSIIYSVGAKALAATLLLQGHKVTEWQASKYIRDFWSKYKGIARWRDFMVAYGKTYGFVPSLYGMVRPLPNISYSGHDRHLQVLQMFEERKAGSSPILMTEAQIVKRAMIKIYRDLHRIPIWEIHDDLTYYIKNTDINDVAPKIKHIMETTSPLCVPTPVDQTQGGDWGCL